MNVWEILKKSGIVFFEFEVFFANYAKSIAFRF